MGLCGLLALPLGGTLSQWKLIHPYPQGATIEAVYFLDTQNGWFVTENGSIWKSTDGGESWKSQRRSFGTRLRAISMSDLQYGWSGGEYNTLLRTTNGGMSWYLSHPWIPFESITRLNFLSRTKGWAATGRGAVYRTIPSEDFWSKTFQWPLEWDEDILVPPGPIVGLSPIDSTVCWAMGRRVFNRGFLGNILARTTNGGTTWDTVRINFTGNVSDMTFADAVRGWYLSDSASIVGTTDGGTSWRVEFATGQLSPEPLRDIHVAGPSGVWSVGNRGLLVRSPDGGSTWTSQELDITTDLRSVHFVDQQVGWSAGTYGRLYKSSDGGVSWVMLYRGIPASFHGVDFVSPARGWAVSAATEIGYAGVYHTSDSGVTWQPQLLSASGGALGIDMVSESTGWVVGQGFAGSEGYKTTNGGATWTPVALPVGEGVHGVKFASSDQGWIYGGTEPGTYRQVILRTTDGGQNWQQVHIDTASFSSTVTDLFSLDPQRVWCVNQYGVYRSTDGGASWQHVYLDPGHPLKFSVTFVDEFRGWMAGVGGIILHSTDGGATWAAQNSNSRIQFQRIRFIDAQRGWACGLGGTVHTNDGGVTWILDTLETNAWMFDLASVIDHNRFFIWSVGWEGTVLRWTDNLTHVSQENLPDLPSSFALHQNYPNPFNPTTTITYTLTPSLSQRERGAAAEMWVSLKVYDVLGREVATLVDGQYEPGVHRVTFDGTGLAGGVYFYRLVAGGSSRTRRLVLLK